MKKSRLILGMLCAASAAWATIITDDFNRPDQDYTNDCSLIGVGWDQDVATNKWSINGGKVYANPGERPAVMYNTGLEMLSGNGTNFTFSMEVTAREDSLWSGIVFNYQNPGNFYVLRFKTAANDYQLLSSVDGSLGILNTGHASTNFVKHLYYTLTVTSDAAYDFDFSISEGGTVLAFGYGVEDGTSNFTGGYAGMYVDQTGGAPAKYDNFSLEVGPPPPTVTTLVTDDFNRAETPYTNDTSVIGAHWQNSSMSNNWAINTGGSVYSDIHESEAVLYNDELITTSGGGTNFTFSLDVLGRHDYALWSGIAFNYQDSLNYYVIRYKNTTDDFQILAKINGVWSQFGGGNASEIFANETYYTITVVSDNVGAFSYRLAKTADGTVIASGIEVDDTGADFTGGYAGFYQSQTGGAHAKIDNFSLEVGPPPAEVVDDFNRADTLPSNNTLLLGGDWTQAGGSNEWFIGNNSMNAQPHANPAVLYNTALGTGTNFTLSVDVAAKTNDTWVGVAFNYQDNGNFYYLRFKGGSDNYQLIGAVGGNQTAEVLVNLAASATFATGTYYTVTIASDSPYDFDFTIVETGSSTVLNGTTNAVDGTGSFTGGYAGLYSPSAGGAKFDNFNLQGPPEAPGYAGWAAGWGVDIGPETNDYDEDGLVNVYEYGLGGDPTNAADQGTSPEFGIVDVGGTNWVGYVHPQLSDPDSGLSYYLETSTDLAIGTWTNSGYTVSGTNVTGGELDFVTNVTDTVASEKFIRLIIE